MLNKRWILFNTWLAWRDFGRRALANCFPIFGRECIVSRELQLFPENGNCFPNFGKECSQTHGRQTVSGPSSARQSFLVLSEQVGNPELECAHQCFFLRICHLPICLHDVAARSQLLFFSSLTAGSFLQILC